MAWSISRSFVVLLSLLSLACSQPLAEPLADNAPTTLSARNNHRSKHGVVSRAMKHKKIGYVNIGYYVNWAIYGRNYQPQQLPHTKLTHVYYAFANVNNVTGEVFLSDPWSDIEKRYPTDSTTETGTNVYGCVKQLYLLKKKNRHLKVLLSIGGWTYSPNFAVPMATPAGRSKFAESAVKLVEDLGFDGIDIDWEYPKDDGEAANFVSLLEDVRCKLDSLTRKCNGGRMLLAVACPAGPKNYELLRLSEMNEHVDTFNLMAYDYAGSFSNFTGFMDNLYPSKSNPQATEFNTEQAVDYYLSKGVPSSKLVLGMPLYGRAFNGTEGMGKPFTGVGNGTWEAGVYDYKVLPLPGAKEIMDEEVGGVYSWDEANKMIVSYDNKEMSLVKTKYIKHHKLGGGSWWETSGDRNDTGSLIATVYDGLKAMRKMDETENTLTYPGSKYANLKAGMPGE